MIHHHANEMHHRILIGLLFLLSATAAQAGRCDPVAATGPVHNALLDLDAFEQAVGVTEVYTAPTRNPDPDAGLGCPDDDTDRQKAYVTVINDLSWPAASRWKMWYSGGSYWPFYAESSDGVNWDRPCVGQVGPGCTNAWSWSGLDGAEGQVMHVLYDGAQYISVRGTSGPPWTTAHQIWTSPGPVGPWTMVADLDPEYPHRSSFGPGHGMSLVQLGDGTWVSYAQVWQPGIRSIGAYTAAVLEGPWTYQGVVVQGPSFDDQRHGITVQSVGDGLIGIAESYDGDPLRGGPLYLVTSRDGLTWDDPGRLLLDYGDPGSPDSAMLFKGSIAGGHLYYTGGHSNVLPFEAVVGVADVDLERMLGYSAASGHMLTHEIDPPAGAGLFVTADAAGGEMRVAVVVPFTGADMVGFGSAEFDAIASDVTGIEATWAGQPLPQGQPIKLRFELTSATIYSYRIE